VKLLRAAVGRSEEEGVVLPITLGVSESGPPREVVERAWQRFCVEFGSPESEPPPSGTRRAAPHDSGPPSSSPRSGRLAKVLWLLPLAGVLIGASLGADRGRDERDEAAAAAITSAVPVELNPSPAATVAATPDAAAVTIPPPPVPPRPGRPASPGRFDDDLNTVRRGHAALAAGNLEEALAAFADHARRFPRSGSVAERDTFWADACARYRSTHGHADPRCSGRP
jgi:hypothetical protein